MDGVSVSPTGLISALPALLAMLAFAAVAVPAVGDAQQVAAETRQEATAPNAAEHGHPLPVITSWTSGHFRQPSSAGWRPANQMELIEQGHHLMPWFSHPPRDGEVPADPEDFLLQYYKEPILQAARLRLPITFIASQWERVLSEEPYSSLPPEQNPNVIDREGRIVKKVSPFGPAAPWAEAGRSYTDNPWMKQIQQWYPDPPLVIFLSNNEHAKLTWTQVETSKRYMDLCGAGKDDDTKRRLVGDGWIERYRALQEGMRSGLTEQAWRDNARFVGYGAFAPEFIGRWAGWTNYSLHTDDRLTPYPLMWDGSSPSYYTHDWNPSRDDTMWSPQIEFMNLVFMKDRAHDLNPDFWVEFSVWDGYDGPRREKQYPSPRTLYRMQGQTYGPERYAGYVQFGMWLLRPRAVREYRGWTFPWEDEDDWEGGGPYFVALAEAVDSIYRSPILTEWWRHGELVPNRRHPHPYQSGIPDEYKTEDRWFLLDADVNMQEFPWEPHWPVNVYSLALVRGEAPNREWLIYSHSPHEDRPGVVLTVPEYRDITIDVTVAGSFYVVSEHDRAVTAVE